MVLMGEGEPSNCKVTQNTEAFLSTQPTRKTAKMIQDKGENYGAGTESSSTQCSVSINADYASIQKNVVDRLVDSFSENREDILSLSNNKLTEVLEEANKLFKDGKCGRIYLACAFSKLNPIIILTNIYLEKLECRPPLSSSPPHILSLF